MAKATSSRPPTQAVRALRRLTGLSLAQCADLVGAVRARKPGIRWIAPVAGPIAFLGWMFMFGRLTDVLEGTRWDILALLTSKGILGTAGIVLLGFGVAITLGIVVGELIPRAVLRRALFYHLYSPACFWCGYSLHGLHRSNPSIQCPECGRHSPVRFKDESPQSVRSI